MEWKFAKHEARRNETRKFTFYLQVVQHGVMSSVALGCLLDKVRLGDAHVTRRDVPRTVRVSGTRDSNPNRSLVFSTFRPSFAGRLAWISSRHDWSPGRYMLDGD